MADRDHPAARAAGQIGVGLDDQHHQTLPTANVGITGDVEDVHALRIEQLIVRAHYDAPAPYGQ
ncbi:hypothetical protein [Streptomyces sp. Ncost-T10-10d]|uniref:hypothetical protein n=1 Tax=Streptomyces sp. Ncost-T10-10d TaxID=1839774 RepID=UPI000B8886B9|nr:hypothetical protein [Streptomyces sp. Ncost-T10-10d]